MRQFLIDDSCCYGIVKVTLSKKKNWLGTWIKWLVQSNFLHRLKFIGQKDYWVMSNYVVVASSRFLSFWVMCKLIWERTILPFDHSWILTSSPQETMSLLWLTFLKKLPKHRNFTKIWSIYLYQISYMVILYVNVNHGWQYCTSMVAIVSGRTVLPFLQILHYSLLWRLCMRLISFSICSPVWSYLKCYIVKVILKIIRGLLSKGYFLQVYINHMFKAMQILT